MAVPTSKQKEIAHRQEKIAKLYLRGWTQQAIADECSVAVGTVNRDLQILQKRWEKNADADISTRKANELAKLDALEAQAWESYFKSMLSTEKGQSKRKTPAQKKGAKPKEAETQFVKQIENAGEPRFLNIVENCIEKRCRILGIDAPGKIEVTGPAGGPIEYKERSSLAISALANMLKNNGVGLIQEDDPDDGEEQPPARENTDD